MPHMSPEAEAAVTPPYAAGSRGNQRVREQTSREQVWHNGAEWDTRARGR